MRFEKDQELAAQKEIMWFGAKLFVSPTGSRNRGEMKVPMMTTSGHKAPSSFSEMVNGHFKSWILSFNLSRKIHELNLNWILRFSRFI